MSYIRYLQEIVDKLPLILSGAFERDRRHDDNSMNDEDSFEMLIEECAAQSALASKHHRTSRKPEWVTKLIGNGSLRKF